MRRRVAKIFGLIAVWIGLNQSAALACTCISRTPNEVLQEADIVFAGKAVAENQEDRWISRIEFERRPPFIHLTEDFELTRTTFEVSTVWKGEPFVKTSVVHGGPCGGSFRHGEEYLVYAAWFEGKLYTNVCWRNNKLIDASEDLAAFGAGRPPAPRPSFYGRGVIAVITLLSLLGSAAWLARRKYGVQKL